MTTSLSRLFLSRASLSRASFSRALACERDAAARMLLALCLVGIAGACRLQEDSGQIGKECDEARECDDETLGCVPIDVDNPARGSACMPPPEDFTCKGELYGDGACDCGCAVIDLDCPNELVVSCAENGNQCPDGENPDPLDNTQCI